MTTLRDDYLAACAALKALAPLVLTAEELRYEAPPGFTPTRGEIGSNVADVTNPTLDLVLDPRRASLSQEASYLAARLRALTVHVRMHSRRLSDAVERWEGSQRP